MLRRAAILGLRLLGREWKSGELGILLVALTVAVGALTGVGFLVNRISQSVALQANEVLAADLRLESASAALDEKYAVEAKNRGLRTARTTSVLSVVFRDDRNQLANLRAVGEGYPLRGTVGVAQQAFGVPTPVDRGPGRGEAWPDSKLLAAIDARVGDTVSVGAASLRITRVLITRPDQGGGFGELAPSMLIHADDLPSTRLLQPGSRATHALLFAGDRKQIERFKTWLDKSKQRGERLRDVAEASPQIQNAIDRAGGFLSLASLVAVLLCAIAVAMAARRYVQRHLDSVALLKTLGATRGLTLAVSLLQLLIIALAAAALGSALGFLAQQWLLKALQGLLVAELPPPDLVPLVLGLLTSVALLAGFALPPLLQLSRVPAIRVLRRDMEPPPPVIWLAFGPAVAAVVFLVWYVVRDPRIFFGFVIGLAAFTTVLALAGWALVRIAGSLRGTVGVSWRYGIANLSRRRAESVVQIVAFGLGLMVLLLLAVVRNDLLNDWRRSLPADLPNFFFINIPPDERVAFFDFLSERGASRSRALPMIRARLTQLNGKPVESITFGDPRGEGYSRRDQNITWQAELGNDNVIVAGRWWTAAEHGRPLVSISDEYQQGLGLRIGDRMTFDVAGETIEAQVASVRKIKWDSFQPNFFVVFPPGLLDELAGTWMTSAYFKPGDGSVISDLVRRFPSVSVFDLDDLLAQVRSVVDKAVLAVQSVFVFTLFAGLVVLLAAVQASRDERRYESAMLRTLGASRGTVARGIIAEFSALGLLSGLLAAIGASIAGYFLARQILQVSYVFDPLIWLIGLFGGGLLVATSGWLATRSVLKQPPASTLRGGSA
jgi:putative ABC transport system permease protein